MRQVLESVKICKYVNIGGRRFHLEWYNFHVNYHWADFPFCLVAFGNNSVEDGRILLPFPWA